MRSMYAAFGRSSGMRSREGARVLLMSVWRAHPPIVRLIAIQGSFRRTVTSCC